MIKISLSLKPSIVYHGTEFRIKQNVNTVNINALGYIDTTLYVPKYADTYPIMVINIPYCEQHIMNYTSKFSNKCDIDILPIVVDINEISLISKSTYDIGTIYAYKRVEHSNDVYIKSIMFNENWRY